MKSRSYRDMRFVVNLNVDQNSYLTLTKLNNSLKKYIGNTKFKYNNFYKLYQITLTEFDINDFIFYHENEILKDFNHDILFSDKDDYYKKNYESKTTKELFVDEWNLSMKTHKYSNGSAIVELNLWY